MARYRLQGSALTTIGGAVRVVPGATITFTAKGASAPATLYESNTGTSNYGTSVTADENGQYDVYVEYAEYYDAEFAVGSRTVDERFYLDPSEAVLEAKDEAFDARDKAKQWANEDEDVAVENGEYSAKHWSKKAQAIVVSSVESVIDDTISDAKKGFDGRALTKAELIASPDVVVGQSVDVLEVGRVILVPASTYTANGSTVIDLTGSGLQAVLAPGEKVNSPGAMLADTREADWFTLDATDGSTTINTPEGYGYIPVSTGAQITTAGGVGLVVMPLWTGAEGGIYHVAAFGAPLNGTDDDYPAAQACCDAASARSVADTGDKAAIYFPGTNVMLSQTVEILAGRNIDIYGAGKYVTDLQPLSGFTGDGLLKIGNGGTNLRRVTLNDMTVDPGGQTEGEGLHGVIVDVYYNFDMFNCCVRGGQPGTGAVETAGLYVIECLHLRVVNSQFHNSLGYGILIGDGTAGKGTSGGVTLSQLAFDEQPAGIVALNNIGNAELTSCVFGPISENAALPSSGRHVDLSRALADGELRVTGCDFGSGEFGIFANQMDVIQVVGGSFSNITRFGIARKNDAGTLTVEGGTRFWNVGTAATTTDPANGTTDPETTPFCCDIFVSDTGTPSGQVNIQGIVSNTAGDSTAGGRPSIWATGANHPNLTIAGNVTETGVTAYIFDAKLLDRHRIEGGTYTQFDGAWTPTVSTGTVTVDDAWFEISGNMVTAHCQISGFSDRTATSDVTVESLPVAPSASSKAGSAFGRYIDGGGYALTPTIATASGGNIKLLSVGTGNWSVLQHTALNNASSTLVVTAQYQKSA